MIKHYAINFSNRKWVDMKTFVFCRRDASKWKHASLKNESHRCYTSISRRWKVLTWNQNTRFEEVKGIDVQPRLSYKRCDRHYQVRLSTLNMLNTNSALIKGKQEKLKYSISEDESYRNEDTQKCLDIKLRQAFR